MSRNYRNNNLIPALLWCGISLPFVPWHLSAVSALMLFRCGVVAYCLLMRQAPLSQTDSFRTWVSRAAAFIPLGLYYTTGNGRTDMGGLTLVVLGTFLVCLSCLDLGKSFGVSPAVRPYVSNGIYRFLPHPMYLGHFITEAGIFIISPNLRNASVIAMSWSLYVLRIRWESELIESYSKMKESNQVLPILAQPSHV